MKLERDSNPGFEYGGRRPHPRQPLDAGNGTQTTGNKEVGLSSTAARKWILPTAGMIEQILPRASRKGCSLANTFILTWRDRVRRNCRIIN